VAGVLILALILAFLPLVVKDPYILHIFVMIFFYAVYALSWNFLALSGQLSLGHAAFLGLGCYTTALAVKMGFPLGVAVAFAPLIAGLAGLFLGVICVRLREWFLALATLAFSIILEPIFGSWEFAGRRGGIPVPSFFGPGKYLFIQEYYLFFAFFLASSIVLYWLLKGTRLGVAFSAIRQNEFEAELSGINTVRYKLICFIISAFFAGLAGAFYAQYVGRITPKIFSLDYSLMPALIAIVGGCYVSWGPIIGSAIIMVLFEGLKMVPLYGMSVARMIIIGFLLILFVIFAPRGLAPIISRPRFRRGKT